MNTTPRMANLNRPRIVSAEKLTQEDIDRAIAERPWPQRRVEPLPPMTFDPHQAAHAASEVDDDLPISAGDRRIRAVLAWAYVALICAVGYLAIFY